MTYKEIDIAICEHVMGWTVKKSKVTKSLRIHNGSFFFANLEEYKFSSDMNFAYKMEQEIENKGFQVLYGDILGRYVQDQHRDKFSHPSMNWICAHASPRVRCLAALEAVGAPCD